jgi:hypothetical protein
MLMLSGRKNTRALSHRVKLRHYLGYKAGVGHDIELTFVREGKEGSVR